MGMTCTIHRATEADLDRLLEDPDALQDFLDPGGASAVREVRPKGLLGLLLRLTPVRVYEGVPEAEAALPPADPEREVDIEKAWHGLHFLLTGSAEEVEGPAGFLLGGGEALDDEGSARALRPEYVRRIAGLLDSLTIEALRGRYDPRRMAELDIYPGIWKRASAPDENPLGWLTDSFEDVKGLVARAARAGEGLIVRVS